MPIYLADTPICLVCVLRKSDLNLAGLPLRENRPLCMENKRIVTRGERGIIQLHICITESLCYTPETQLCQSTILQFFKNSPLWNVLALNRPASLQAEDCKLP